MYPEVSFLPAADFVSSFRNLLGSFCMVMKHRTFLIGKFFLNSYHYNVISVFVTRRRMIRTQTDLNINPVVVAHTWNHSI